LQLPLLELDLLRTLIAAVDRGTLREAARVIGRTESAVSLQMKRLDELVGVKLLEKRGRSLRLTTAGEQLVDYARRFMDLNYEALQAVSGFQIEGRVRLGLVQDFAEGTLPNILAAFSRAHPSVELEVKVERSCDLATLFLQDSLDLMLFFCLGRPPARIASTLVGSAPMVWVWREPLTITDEIRLILFEPPCVFRRTALKQLAGRRWKQSFLTSSLSGTWAAVQAGLGISLRSPIGLPRSLSAGTNLPGQKELPQVSIYLGRRERSPSAAVDRLQVEITKAVRESLSGMNA
jgi:DNA-binding transcriptional LysR family regulator